jgi:acetyltransferase
MKHPIDPSQNFLKSNINPLSGFFAPNSIAIVGATTKEGSVGATLLQNLVEHGYKGKIYPVNPKYPEILGLKCFASLSSICAPIDLAVIVTPAATVPSLVKEATSCQVGCIIIISAGFKELGEKGEELEKEVLSNIKGTKTRIIGPNCLGLMNPHSNLNVSFAAGMPLKGKVAFISQSGAMCTSILDWSLKEKIGFSAFVSIGSMADVGWGDLIDYLGHDPNTSIILLYMETIGNARAFLSAAKKVALTKPIILIKAGRTELAAKAASSHTGSLAGSDDAFNAAIARVGALRVNSISELFAIAQSLSKQPMPKGPNLTIITNAGGPGVLATDEAILAGAELTKLSPDTIEKLNSFLPEAWSHSNPIDVLGDAKPDSYAKALKAAIEDKSTDGILVILTPQSVTDPTQTAEEIAVYSKSRVPIYASWMGGSSLDMGIKILSKAGIAHFAYPDDACDIFGKLYEHSSTLKNLYETPHQREGNLNPSAIQTRIQLVDRILFGAHKEKRQILTEFESKEILEAYGIPTVKTLIAKTKEEAVAAANSIGYPVVVKLHSYDITHKTDVGGVKLNLANEEAVLKAFEEIQNKVPTLDGVTVQKMVSLKGYEILLGSIDDQQFGPIIVFGMGGTLVEVFKDRALGIPPLNSVLARKQMAQTKIYKALEGVRGGKAINFDELERIMILFSQLIIEHAWIKECDINPLLVSDSQIIALDARFILHEKESDFVKSALRPYPHLYTEKATLKDGSRVTIRPICPEDEEKVKQFHEKLSENTVRSRFLKLFSVSERTMHDRLIQVCCIDYDREMRFVGEEDGGAIVAIGSYTRLPNTMQAEFKLIVADSVQGKGLGKKMLVKLVQTAKHRNLESLFGVVLNENKALLKICESLGFKIEAVEDNPNLFRVTCMIVDHTVHDKSS